MLNLPNSLAMDKKGNLFIADMANHRIRKIDSSGIVSTIAGNGIAGFSGDGGFATQAKLNNPTAIAFDAKSNLLIVDRSNMRIRKIDTLGIISTIAGNGIIGFAGDGFPATNASFNTPVEIAIDKNENVFIVDMNNSRIRRIDSKGIVTTAAGNGSTSYNGDGIRADSAGLNLWGGLAIDKYNNLFIGDGNRLRKVNTEGYISTIAGGNSINYGDGGQISDAEIRVPNSITFDISGNILLADGLNFRIRKISYQTNQWTGVVNSQWENPLNWSLGRIPVEADNVVINVGTVVIHSNPNVRSLTLSPGVNFSVDTGFNLNITY